MARLSGACIVAVVVLGALLAPGAATGAAGTSHPAQVGQEPAVTDEFVVEVYANGSARWTVQTVRPLDNASVRQRFEAFAERFTSRTTPLYEQFRRRATGLTSAGTNATGRTMRATSFRRDAYVVQRPNANGVVEMSFLWTNFTASDGGRMVIGDAFRSGLAIAEGDSVEIRAGPGLDIRWEGVEPTWDSRTDDTESTNGSVTWNGPVSFSDSHPRVAFVPAADGSSSGMGLPVEAVALGGALALAVVAAAGVVLFVRRSRRSPAGSEGPDSPAGAGTDGGTATARTGAADTDPARRSSPSGLSEDALRTDEDRVIDLLEANGGRMKQVRIVEETDWSKSKVSTLLTGMADDGTISKLRLGRENVVSLEGHEPDVASPPFDEE